MPTLIAKLDKPRIENEGISSTYKGTTSRYWGWLTNCTIVRKYESVRWAFAIPIVPCMLRLYKALTKGRSAESERIGRLAYPKWNLKAQTGAHKLMLPPDQQRIGSKVFNTSAWINSMKAYFFRNDSGKKRQKVFARHRTNHVHSPIHFDFQAEHANPGRCEVHISLPTECYLYQKGVRNNIGWRRQSFIKPTLSRSMSMKSPRAMVRYSSFQWPRIL